MLTVDEGGAVRSARSSLSSSLCAKARARWYMASAASTASASSFTPMYSRPWQTMARMALSFSPTPAVKITASTPPGFTPLAGVPMGTRSGDLDAGILQYEMNKRGMGIVR